MTTPLPLDGFETETLFNSADGLIQPISLEFLPDGRMLVIEKSGRILIADTVSQQIQEYGQLPDINTGGERGLLDITLDPDFANNGYIYLYYTPASVQSARIARFTHQENSGGLTSQLDTSSELVLWNDTDGYISCCHYGAGLDFGIDGKIWLTTSDKFETSAPGESGGSNADDLPALLTSTSGKVIRINPDGTIPDGTDGWAANPFIDASGDPNNEIPDSIWAYGLRNPFRASWDEEYGNFYIGEVGGNQSGLSSENLHIASLDQPGVFYGWPFYEGENDTLVNTNNESLRLSLPSPDGDLGDPANGDFFSSPIFSYDRDSGASITGGGVYRGDLFPAEWDGVYFYGDFSRNEIRYLRLDPTGREVLGDFAFAPTADVPDTPTNIVWLGEGADGALYYIRFSGGGGEIRRVGLGDNGNNPPTVNSLDAQQSGGNPLEVVFTANVADFDGDPLTVTLDFGDGSTDFTGTPDANGDITVTHVYPTDGFFTASLSVTDGLATAFSAPLDVIAGDPNNPPTIGALDILPAFGEINESLTFDADVFDLDGDALTFTWFFGDGNSQSGSVGPTGDITLTHDYDTEGLFFTRLEVTDTEGNTTVSSNISVQIGQTGDGLTITDGLVLDLQSTIKIGLSGSTVTNWLDGSGQGNNLTATGAPEFIVNSTPTGAPSIRFDGTDDALSRVVDPNTSLDGIPNGNGDRTVFFVVDYISGRSPIGFSYGDADTHEGFSVVARGRSSELTIDAYREDFRSGVTSGDNVGDDEWIVQSAVLENDTLSHFLNGALIDTDTFVFQTDTTDLTSQIIIGQALDGSDFSEIDVAAVLVYDRALSATERAEVESFLQEKFISGQPTGGNQPPTGSPTAALPDGQEDVATTILEADLLQGITDPDGDPLDVINLSASVGAIVDNMDGTFTHTAPVDFNGSVDLTYDVIDGQGGTLPGAMQSFTILPDNPPGNQPPTGSPTANLPNGQEDVATTILEADLLQGIIDPDGDPLDVVNLSASVGAIVDNMDGTFTHTAPVDFSGSVDLTYDVIDGQGGTLAGVTQDFTILPDNPGGGGLITAGLIAEFQADTNVATIGGTNTVNGWLDGSGFGNDLAGAGDPQLLLGATPSGQSAIVFDGDGDALARTGGANLAFLPDGASDRTVFFVVDYMSGRAPAGVVFGDAENSEAFGLVARGRSSELSVERFGGIFRSGVNSGDNQGDDEWIVQSAIVENDVLTHYLNGAVIDTDTFTFNTDIAAATSQLVIGQTIDGQAFSGLSVAAVLIYDRALSEVERAQVEGFLQDKYLGAPSGPLNIAPVAQNDAFTTDEDVAVSGNVLAANGGGADSDPDNGPLPLSVTPANFTTANGGAVALSGNGDFTYTPAPGFFGSDSFLYTLSDGQDTDTATVSLTVLEDTAPTDDFRFFLLDPNTETVLRELFDGDSIDPAELSTTDYSVSAEYVGPGTVESAQFFIDGSFAKTENIVPYTLFGDSVSPVDFGGGPLPSSGFQLSVTGYSGDNASGSVVHTEAISLSIGAPPANQAPVAEDDTFTTGEDTAIAGNLLAANGGAADSDPDGGPQPLSVAPASFTTANNGAVSISANGDFTYTPAAGFSGADTFTYTLSDGADTDQGAVTVTVTPAAANQAPVAEDDAFTTVQDFAVNGNVLAANGGPADSDPDGGPQPLSVAPASFTTANGGTVTVSANGDFTYTPAAGFTGSDAFDYTLSDGEDTDIGTVNITVNTPPNPGALPVTSGLALLLESDAGLSAAGGQVTAWADQSGQGNDVSTTADAANDPTVGSVFTPTGQLAIELDGDGDQLTRLVSQGEAINGLPSGGGDRTVFFVVDYVDPNRTTAGAAFGDRGRDNTFGLTANSNGDLTVQGFATDYTSTVNGVGDGVGADEWFVQSAVLSNQMLSHYQDGVLIDSAATTFDTDLQKIVLGAEIRGTRFAELNIAAVIVYDRALSETERTEVEAYLQEKYITGGAQSTQMASIARATLDDGDALAPASLAFASVEEADIAGAATVAQRETEDYFASTLSAREKAEAGIVDTAPQSPAIAALDRLDLGSGEGPAPFVPYKATGDVSVARVSLASGDGPAPFTPLSASGDSTLAALDLASRDSAAEAEARTADLAEAIAFAEDQLFAGDVALGDTDEGNYL